MGTRPPLLAALLVLPIQPASTCLSTVRLARRRPVARWRRSGRLWCNLAVIVADRHAGAGRLISRRHGGDGARMVRALDNACWRCCGDTGVGAAFLVLGGVAATGARYSVRDAGDRDGVRTTPSGLQPLKIVGARRRSS